ncbi:MAG: hypothetical protein VYB71_04115, partial [Chloroflexota bacterium]|nr:hypothetical protein [Chloroflexota bacterium]
DGGQIKQRLTTNNESIERIIHYHVEYWETKQDRMPDAGIESEHQANRIKGRVEIQTNTTQLIRMWDDYIDETTGHLKIHA